MIEISWWYRIVVNYALKYEDFHQSIKNDLILNERWFGGNLDIVENGS